MKKIISLFCFILFFTVYTSYSQVKLKLIPLPQIVEVKIDSFLFSTETCLKTNYQDSFLIAEVVNSIQNEFHTSILSKDKAKSNYVELVKASSLKDFKSKLKSDDLNKKYEPGEEGYIIDITKKSIKIYALTDAGLFYGVQTFKQLVSANSFNNKIEALTIYDKPDIAVRAWQDDISRGPIPTLDFLKKQIVKMSSYKLNYFTLYTEHVFKLKKHPTLAPDDGITAEEIAELTEFAKQYHVELIGNFQSFGHMEKILSKPGYEYLAENHHIISPALEASYKFLGDVYSEVASAYKGRYFNINCDETDGLGEGKSKAMMDSLGIGGIYSYHINRVDKLLKPYGKRILMWGDIVASHPEIVKNLPKDMTIISWGYHDAPSFDYAIKPLASSGLNFWVAPGVSCWSQAFPNEKVATINIFNYIRDGVKHGASGVLNTVWDDDGSNLFNNNWYGLVWGAELCWKAPNYKYNQDSSIAEREHKLQVFNNCFDALFFGIKRDKSISEIITSFSEFHQSKVRNVEGNGSFFSPIFTDYKEEIQSESHIYNIELISRLDSLDKLLKDASPLASCNQNCIDFLNFAMKEVRLTVMKNLFKTNLNEYLNHDTTMTEKRLQEELIKLISNVNELKKEYVVLWNQENRNWWLDKNMKRFDDLLQDMKDLRSKCLLTVSDTLDAKGKKVVLRSVFENLPVYYTFDGSEPTIHSQKYDSPFYFNKDVIIKARIIEGDKMSDVVCDSFMMHKAVGKLRRLNSIPSTYHPSYYGGGKMALVDGRTGNSTDICNGRWQGFSGQDINVELDFGKVEKLNSFAMGFYQNTQSWVYLPKRIDILTSEDGNFYTLYKTINHTYNHKETKASKCTIETELKGLQTRYLKVVAVYFGKLPEWHSSAGNESMMFSDEIIIK